MSYYLENAPIQYADDTTLLFNGVNLDSLVTTTQIHLDLFHKWSLANFLSLNAAKTKFMLFAKNKFIGPMQPITINTTHIQQVSSIKFLGIHIDSELNFKEHFKKLRWKLSRIVGLSYS